MQSPSKKKKGIWYIKLYILLYETIYQRRQLLGRAKRYAPSLQIHFWFIPQILFLLHFHMLTLCRWVIGGHRRPTHPRKGKQD